ncbi:hypothetical protein NDU88_003906, partial [Pleurodeles waltl]
SATLSLPSWRMVKIYHELRRSLARQQISLRRIAHLVGLLSSSIREIFPGPLHYRALQRLKAAHLRRGFSYANMISLSEEAQEEIRWWLSHIKALNGRAIFGSAPDLIIESDLNRSGWGARCGDFS